MKKDQNMKPYFLPLSLGLASLCAIATPASAQTFEGPYVGAQAGWSQNKLGTVETDGGAAQIDDSRDAATAGIFFGYNIQPANRVVLSAEGAVRSEEHTSELQSLMRYSYAVLCLKKKKNLK